MWGVSMRAPLLGTLEGREERPCRWESLFIRAPLGNMDGGSSTGDFDRWIKGAVGMERLSLSLSLSEKGQCGGLLY
jgi:hypothetical protein